MARIGPLGWFVVLALKRAVWVFFCIEKGHLGLELTFLPQPPVRLVRPARLVRRQGGEAG